MKTIPSPIVRTYADKVKIAQRFGVSVERLNEQYLSNSQQMLKMSEKAFATGKKVNGYTDLELKQKAAYFEYLAHLTA